MRESVKMEGVLYIEHFIEQPELLFEFLLSGVDWDQRIAVGMTEFPPEIAAINSSIAERIGISPNNCLINYYPDGQSKMGYHSDQTDILAEGTGIVIVSVGAMRTLNFKNIADPAIIESYDLPAGSLIYMTQSVQDEWKHAIPASDPGKGRISLTFRKMK